MTDGADDLDPDVPATGSSGLQRSLSNLISQFGQTDSVAFGLTVNTGTALIGLVVWYYTSGVVAALALAWAVLNLLAIVRWVIE